NILTEYRTAQGESFEEVWAAAEALAAELVRLPVDVIAAGLGQAVRGAVRGTTTIPLVLLSSQDPVLAGTVASLARPGGHVTGLSLFSTELAGKRLEMLHAIVPGLSRAAALLEPGSQLTYELEATQAAARQLGVELLPLLVRQPGEHRQQLRHPEQPGHRGP